MKKYLLDRKRCAEYIGSVPRKQKMLFVGYFFTLLCLVVASHLAIGGAFSTLVGLLVVLLFLLIWMAYIEVVLLLQDVALVKVLLALSVIVFGLLFVRSIEAFVGLVVFAIFCAESFRRLKHERRKSIGVTIGGVVHPLRHILPIFTLGVCFLLASCFVTLVVTPDSTPEQPIPRQVFDSVFEPIEQGIQFIFSDYDPSLQINEVRELIVQDVFGGQWFEQDIQNIEENISAIAEEVEQDISAIAEEVEQDISAVAIQDTRPLRDYLYDTINDTIRTPLISFFWYLSIFGIVVLFIILRLLFIVLLWISYLVTYLVIKLLLRYGIILMNEQPSTHQNIQFT